MSQANALISRPLIRPTPCSHLFKNYVFYDNFADLIYTARKGVAANGFRYQDWTVGTGTWTAAAGYLTKTAPDQNYDNISALQPRARGTWEYKIKLSDTVDTHRILYFFISDTPNTAAANGYVMQVHYTAADGYVLLRVNGGAGSAILTWANAPGVAEHEIRITRDAAGNFELFVDGTSRGTVLDNTHTASAYQVVRSYSTDCYIDDIRVY